MNQYNTYIGKNLDDIRYQLDQIERAFANMDAEIEILEDRVLDLEADIDELENSGIG